MWNISEGCGECNLGLLCGVLNKIKRIDLKKRNDFFVFLIGFVEAPVTRSIVLDSAMIKADKNSLIIMNIIHYYNFKAVKVLTTLIQRTSIC